MLIALVLSSSICLGYNVSSENIYTYNDGTAKVGTFYINNTIVNESDDVIYSTNTSFTSNINGKFKKVIDVPYFGNSTLRMRVILDTTDTGYQEISYVPYSINSQYLQGHPITYFASLAQVQALIAANGNWSDDKFDYYTATEVNNGFYTKAATDILLGNKLDSVDQRYNDSSLVVSVNDSWKSNMSNTLSSISDNNASMKNYVDTQDNLDYKEAFKKLEVKGEDLIQKEKLDKTLEMATTNLAKFKDNSKLSEKFEKVVKETEQQLQQLADKLNKKC